MRFKTSHNVRIDSPTFAGVVNQLRKLSWDIEPKDDFMETVAARLRMLGRVVDTSNPRTFVLSLVLYGYLTKEED